jgi:DNA-binding HxlR family transcriptional regulator
MYEKENCSAARAMEMVGERWSLLIIRNAAFAGMTRFSEFERRLGVAPNILANRLAGFVENGLMEVSGTAYRLTPKGRELAEVVMALTAWGDRWAAPDGPPVLYRHAGCGGAVTVTASCAGCAGHPPVSEVVALPGPGATPAQRAAIAARARANPGTP